MQNETLFTVWVPQKNIDFSRTSSVSCWQNLNFGQTMFVRMRFLISFLKWISNRVIFLHCHELSCLPLPFECVSLAAHFYVKNYLQVTHHHQLFVVDSVFYAWRFQMRYYIHIWMLNLWPLDLRLILRTIRSRRVACTSLCRHKWIYCSADSLHF